MVRSEVLNLSRIMARVDSNGVSDANAALLIDEGYAQVAKDYGGIPKRAHIQMGAKFYIGTDFYFRMTIAGTGDTLAATDIQVSATELTESTGAAVATLLQAAIRVATGGTGTTVAWSAATMKFTITTLLATAQTIGAPEDSVAYTDATGILFGSYESVQDLTWVGGVPEDITLEADLPSDFAFVSKVAWGGTELLPAPRDYFVKPNASGTPCYYDIRNDHIYLYPYPVQQEDFYIEYGGVPVTASTSDTATYSIPTRYHILIVYYTTYLLLLANHEYDKANQHLGIYIREKNKMLVNRYNQNTDIQPAASDTIRYNFVVTS